MKTYRGSRSIAPVILNYSARTWWVVKVTTWTLYLWETNPAPTEQKAGLAQEPAWMFLTRQTSLVPTLEHPTCCPVAIPNILPWLPLVFIISAYCIKVLFYREPEGFQSEELWWFSFNPHCPVTANRHCIYLNIRWTQPPFTIFNFQTNIYIEHV
jgi:hypothetical protein